jgi:capsular polysaccharide transport system permease protein
MAHPKPVSIPKNPAWFTQLLVLRALLGRQIQTRFGGYHLGFLWMILEPLAGVLIIGVVIGTLAQRHVPEMPYPFFLLNGMMLLQVLTGCMNAGIAGIDAGKNLLVYPSVKLIDPLIARFLFQLFIGLFGYIVFCIAALWLGVRFSVSNLEVVIACYLITFAIGSGLGLLLGVAVAHYPELEKVMDYLQRPLMFISAVLFPIATIPAEARGWLMWNPLVHTVEQARHALYPYYNPAETNLTYPLVCALAVLSLGFTVFHNNRSFLTSR